MCTLQVDWALQQLQQEDCSDRAATKPLWLLSRLAEHVDCRDAIVLSAGVPLLVQALHVRTVTYNQLLETFLFPNYSVSCLSILFALNCTALSFKVKELFCDHSI